MQAQGIAVLDPRFVVGYPVQLKLKEKVWSWSGDDFKITEASTGATWFKLKGKTISLSDKKEMTDAYGNVVATMRESFFRILSKMTIEGPGYTFDVRTSHSESVSNHASWFVCYLGACVGL